MIAARAWDRDWGAVEQPQNLGQRWSQHAAVDDGVNHPVSQLKFRCVGIFRKTLMHELLDHTGSSKAY
jgi:hypothetical protein